MKKIIFFLLTTAFFACTLSAFTQKVVMDENAELREVGRFSAVQVSGSIDVYLSQGSENRLVVSASDRSINDRIITEVKNGVLIIGLKSGSMNFNDRKYMRAYISAPDLSKISMSGSTNFFVEGSLKVSNLEIEMSGASDFKGDLVVENLRLSGSGSVDFNLTGSSQNLKIEVSGASDVKAKGHTADFCDASASGASDIYISVKQELKATASGASDIKYYGNPSVRKATSSGAASIKKGS
jgi:hypothetical protein